MKYRFYAAGVFAAATLAAPAFAQTTYTATETILGSALAGYNGQFSGTIQASDGYFYPSLLNNSYFFRYLPDGTVSSLKGQIQTACGTTLQAGPIEGPDGDLYAMTSSGGANGDGVFFSYSLVTKTCTALGSVPSTDNGSSQMTIGDDGNFYGTFRYGGANDLGSAYRVTPAGVFTDLYDFDSGGVSGSPDGAAPVGGMLQASDGNWYGQVVNGVTGSNQGGVFQLVPGATVPWAESIYLDFSGPTGYDPTSQPTEWTDGNLYGTLYAGANYGTIWETDLLDNNPDADYFSIPGPDDQQESNLFLAGDGNFYSGLANTAGADDGGFYVFNPGASPAKATYTDLYSFAPGNGDLITPIGAVIQGNDGALYGTANSGGANNYGGIYRIAVTPTPKPVISVTATPNNSSASSITVAWTVREVTSKTAAQCFAYPYVVTGGFNTATTTAGAWGGKLSSTITNFTMSGSITVTPSAVGQYVYAVECQGKIAGLSSVVNVTGLAAAPTRTVLAVSPTSGPIGTQFTATATVTETSGSGVPAGSVNFEVAGVLLGARPVSTSGVATLVATTNGVAPMTYPVYAVYAGDSGNATSTSNTVNVTISKYTTTTTIANPGTQSRSSVTLSATVMQTNGSGAPLPVTSGSVAFYGDGKYLYTASVNSQGVASFTGSATAYPAGTYSITAVYSGTSTESGSNAPAVNITIQ